MATTCPHLKTLVQWWKEFFNELFFDKNPAREQLEADSNRMKLVVGQEICMVAGIFGCWGTVERITPCSVEVRAGMQSNITQLGQLLTFDPYGVGLDEGTHECGPWHLEDNPKEVAAMKDFMAQGKARLEQKAREWKAKHQGAV